MKLHFVNGPEAGKLRDIAQGARIGRETDNDISILSGGLSRYHAVIERMAGDWTLRDLGSTNGTKLNGIPLGSEPSPLKNGDLCTLGDQVFRVEFDPADLAPPSPAPATEPILSGAIFLNLQQSAEPAPVPSPAPTSPAPAVVPPPDAPAVALEKLDIDSYKLFNADTPATDEAEKTGSRLGNYIFMGLVGAAVFVMMAVAVILVAGPDAKPPKPVAKTELPMTLLYERQRSDNGNVFRFTFRLENGVGAKAKIVDIHSGIAYESNVVRLIPDPKQGEDPNTSPWVERKQAYERLREALKHSQFMNLQTAPNIVPDAQNYYRVTACLDNKLNRLDEYSNNPPVSVFELEKAVGEFTYAVLGIPMSKPPEEARADAEKEFKLGEERLLNWRAQPENLREAILHFRNAQKSLMLFNPKPAISITVQRMLDDAMKKKNEELDNIMTEANQAMAMRDYPRALELQRKRLRYLDLVDDAQTVKNTRENISNLEKIITGR